MLMHFYSNPDPVLILTINVSCSTKYVAPFDFDPHHDDLI